MDGNVMYTRHFREELAKDKLTMQDVLIICKSGAVVRAPEPDAKTGQWKYRIEGRSSGGQAAIVFTFRDDLSVMITVFRRG